MAARVGFIGLGIMGDGMSRRLLQNNISLVVWNRSNEKCIKLKEEYNNSVTIANTPKEVLDLCTLNFIMLSTPEACKDVYTKTQGILEGVCEGKRIVDCATLNAEDMQWAATEVTNRGGRFVEAPVGGSKGPAAAGQLIFMTCGDREVVDDSKYCLDAMGKATHFVSTDIGAGSRMKLIVNSIMGNVASVLSEGIHIF
jgi:3-hydroxyisobutyrate dehydrogenase-like beta-hydroxyacid dehydrogenase